eukprot:8291411-Pyramimonas_sp.AAC.1
MICGSYSQANVRNLAVRCDPKGHSGGVNVLSRLKRGLHPQRNVPVLARPQSDLLLGRECVLSLLLR